MHVRTTQISLLMSIWNLSPIDFSNSGRQLFGCMLSNVHYKDMIMV